jgi:hypothetical protein
MRCLRLTAGLLPAVLAVPLMLPGVATGIGPPATSVAASGSWTAVEPRSPGTTNNDLLGVAVLSSSNAWAVGTYAAEAGGRTLVERWNGTAWSVVHSPDPGESGDFLTAVSAVSPASIWAVGQDASPGNTLILHWNGTSWRRVTSPGLGTADDYLFGVHVVSANDIWAVGSYTGGPPVEKTLILHWNGKTWAQVPSPNPGSTNWLYGVTATSGGSAWAVGSTGSEGAPRPFILHWDGATWKQVPAPHLQGTDGQLLGVDAISAQDVWAVGDLSDSMGEQTVILHWNGATWTRTPSPDPGSADADYSLAGLAATSPSNAWAAGSEYNGSTYRSLILHWDGTAWTTQASPNPGSGGNLSGIAASSAANAWAVGQFGTASGDEAAFALHCCVSTGKPTSPGA